jgi:uncharacterized protein (TIGR02231 family)
MESVMMNSDKIISKHFMLGSLVCLMSSTALAQPTESSTISAVIVYQGSAEVERVMGIKATTHQLVFNCLPGSLNVQSLQIHADNGAQIGELSVRTKPHEDHDSCDNSDLAVRIRALESEKAELEAKASAIDLSQSYVKSLSTGEGKTKSNLEITATLGTIARVGQDNALKALQIKRRQDEIEHLLQPLYTEQNRSLTGRGSTISVSANVSAVAPDMVHLSYVVNGPGWLPSYRASLNTKTNKLIVERQALVAQATGEDWSQVRLKLITGRPGANNDPASPQTWGFEIAPPPAPPIVYAHRVMMAYPAPPPPPPPVGDGIVVTAASSPSAQQMFSYNSSNDDYATSYDISTPITVPSNGLKVSMSLGHFNSDAKTYVLVTPKLENSAHLMVELPTPDGVNPAGKMALYRDNAYIGECDYQPASSASQTLAFGADDLIAIKTTINTDNSESDDRTGTPGKRIIARGYEIKNQHTSPVKMVVLEAAPTTEDARISISTSFAPNVASEDWDSRKGVKAWKFDLNAGETQKLKADYIITFPKKEKLQER